VLGQKTAYADSAIATSAAFAMSTTNAPTFSPTAGAYADGDYPGKDVVINCALSGASGRYTINGSNPTSSSGTVFTPGSTIININEGDVLRAICYKTGYKDSAVTTGTYTAVHLATPTLSPNTYDAANNDNVQVTITTTSGGCNIRYTTDGTTPTSSHGTLIAASSGQAIVTGSNTTKTLKAVAYKTGYDTTAVVSGSYTFSSHG
jgi:hypothetical protein